MYPCECDTDVDKDACTKRDENFNGSFSCYVKDCKGLTCNLSTCKELKIVSGGTNPGKQRSASACEDKNEGKLNISFVGEFHYNFI